MRVFTCVDHDNHYVGCASVIVAPCMAAAQTLLDAELVTHGLKPFAASPYELREISLERPQAFVLQNGDY